MEECKPNEHKPFRIWADMDLYQCIVCRKSLSKAEANKLENQGLME